MSGSNEEGNMRMREAPPKSQPFEVALARRLQSRGTSTSAALHDAFLRLDVDGDGFVTRRDLKISLHNVLGVELTTAQMNAIFARFAYFDESMIDDIEVDGEGDEAKSTSTMTFPGKHHGIRYADFVRYILDTVRGSPSSSSDYGSTVDLHLASVDKLESVAAPPNEITRELRLALRRKIRGHTSKSAGGGKGSDTQLFLMMDTDRSGRVTPAQFRSWLGSVGLNLTDKQCKTLLGEHYHEEGIDLHEFVKVIEDLDEDKDGVGSVLTWESTDRRRPVDKQKVSGDKTDLVDAVLKCADDAKSDVFLVRHVAERLFGLRTGLTRAFAKYDVDNTGRLNASELRMAMLEAGLNVSEDRAKSLVNNFDKDGDGRLSKSEFVHMIASGSGTRPGGDNMSTAKATSALPSSLSTSSACEVSEDTGSLSTHSSLREDEVEVKRQALVEAVTGHEDDARHIEIAARLDREDVVAIHRFRRAIEEEMMLARRTFQMFDKDASRDLTAEELLAGFERLGIMVSREHVDHIMARFDPEGTGRLKYNQFIQLLCANLDDE